MPVLLLWRLRNEPAHWARRARRNSLWWLALVSLISADVAFVGRLTGNPARVVLLFATCVGAYQLLMLRRVRRTWEEAFARGRRLEGDPLSRTAPADFGPQGRVVTMFLQRLPFITDEEWRAIEARALAGQASSRARSAALRRIRSAPRAAEREAAADRALMLLVKRVMEVESGQGAASHRRRRQPTSLRRQRRPWLCRIF